MDKLVRGSTDLRLSPEGRDYIRGLNKSLRAKGGCFWRVYTSDQSRAVETAHLLVEGCPNTSFEMPTKHLASWPLGGYEGKPVKDVLPLIKDLVANRPWVIPPGMGKDSTEHGISFNHFKGRMLDETRRIMDCFEQHPSKRIAVVTHFHCIQLVRSWLSKYNGQPGLLDDMYDAKVYNEDNGFPGEVQWLRKQGNTWKLSLVDFDKVPVILPGIYFVRHGATSWN